MLSKKIILAAFFATQLSLIFFYIYTQSIIIKLNYSIQDFERKFQELQKKKKAITHELLQEQDPQNLKHYATCDLQMKKARIADIKEIPDE